jgi:hypothetical protein
MVNSVKEEMKHEAERTVGEPLFNVEDKSVHNVFEDLRAGERQPRNEAKKLE